VSFAVLNGVTRTLAGVLRTATGLEVDSVRSPAEGIADTAPLIHLYLYRVAHNPFFENAAWSAPSATSLEAPPIGLNLFYLLTPYGADQSEIQVTLGEIIQVLHDNAIVAPAAYDPILVGTTEELRVVRHDVPLDTMLDFWRGFEGRSFRLSVCYEASVALIASTRSRTVTRVEERHVRVESLR
jgi:hypothetical protein